ncbi:alpha/beta fold hydrolase [Pseudoalteromonas shioyasakiensis]|uniref:alpha/beta fold hydrolase n=1 Tax=Pseudoalteromonas shioyasakiensis TaxID=1190813 RepID=UPI0021189836|nr:alpha/beta fold hydrolase [Pseudoalteromonas shioyasakiensis]MCQ8876802.1 alpha/beta fold hydrolase [Pseudoalteromonas shioyasakiensis]
MLLNYKQLGQGSPVILIHGLFGSLENLNVIAKALAENFLVINVDLRNHGRSPHSETMDYASMSEDIIALMTHLNITSAHFVGHSMGGKVAMQVAHLFPDKVNRLVVLDIAPVAYQARHTSIFKALKNVASQPIADRKHADTLMQQDIAELGVRQFLLKSLAKDQAGELTWRFNLDVLSNCYENILSDIKANDSCLCDTLFIKGNDSDYILPEYKEAIMTRFKNAKAKIIHGAGHWLHAQKPQAVNKSISDFLLAD